MKHLFEERHGVRVIMDTNLFKVSKVCWAVTSAYSGEVQTFKTIEEASTYLESIYVLDDEIDVALVDMVANEATHASFGEINGKFILSDKLKLNELLGVA